MSKAFRPPEFGVEVVEGLPGSGKSFFGTQRVLRAVTEERRPVYTNLPLRMRVMKRWLARRHGAECAGLVRPLTPQHFTAFLERQARRNRFFEELANQGVSKTQRLERWYLENGPDVCWKGHVGTPAAAWYEERGCGTEWECRGGKSEPNWIPAFSVILIDEAHHWYPQSRQLREDVNLLTYVTMIRHHLQHLYVITQDRMQVSLTFRRLAAYYWVVRDKAGDHIWGPLKVGHLGVKALAYCKYTPDQEEGRKLVDQLPTEKYVCFPTMPSKRWIFRLYDSFTHVGSPRELKRQLREIREEAGLTESGEVRQPVVVERVPMAKVIGKLVRYAMVPLLVLAGVGIGARMSLKVESRAKAVAAADVKPPTITGFVNGAVLFDGRSYREGEKCGSWKVEAVVSDRRVCFVEHGGRLWILRAGRPGQDLGERSKVLNEFRRYLDPKSGGGAGIAGSEGSGGEAVGPAGRDGRS